MVRKKILFLIDTLRDGGAEKILVDIVNHLDPEKYNIEVKLIYKKGAYLDRLNRDVKLTWIADINNKLHCKMISRILPRLSSKSLHKILINGSYDTEIAFLEGYATRIIAGASKKTKKIAWVHCDVTHPNCWINETGLPDSQFIKEYRNFDDIICVAESVKTAFIKRWGEFPSLRVNYNPVDVSAIKEKADSISYIIPKNDKLKIISIGRLTPPKKIIRLFNSIDTLYKLGYELDLYLLGAGEEEQQLKDYILKNDLEDVIHMEGFQKNPYAWMKQCDLYACSSIYEGFSTAVTEAVVLGMPVVTTDVSGMREILGDSEFGLITDNDDDEFTAGLKKLLDSQELLSHYREKARERATFFELDNRLQEIEKVL